MYIIAFVLSFFAGIINPYIGIFGLFNVVELLIIIAFVTNGMRRISIARFAAGSDYIKEEAAYKKSGQAQLTVAMVAALLCCVIYVFICVVVWFVSVYAYGGEVLSTPLDFLKLQYRFYTCMILLFATLGFNLFGTILVIEKRKDLGRKQAQEVEYAYKTVDKVDFQISKTTIIFIVCSMTLCLLNGYISWLGVILNLFFFLSIIILKTNIKAYLKMKDMQGFLSIQANYALSQLEEGEYYNKLFVCVCWVIATTSVFVELVLLQKEIRIGPVVLTGIVGTICGMLAMALQFFSAYSLSHDVKRIVIK